MSEMEKQGSVMVVGGGISGIQSALDLANSGFKVYVVEKGPSIGGVMPQLDKTFPTNDCAMCILSPKLVDAGRHPNIELMTYSELNISLRHLILYIVNSPHNPGLYVCLRHPPQIH